MMEPIAIDPERPLTVTMPARMWNVVTYALNKHPMPFETSAPVIGTVSEQLRAQAMTQPLTTAEMLARTEGEGHANASGMPNGAEPVPDTADRYVDGDGTRVAPGV
jgi:hypothetical protein